MSGKTVVVTGANSGTGFEASRIFAEKNAEVVMACRSPERGRNAVEEIEEEVPGASLDLRILDLASLESVEEFSEGMKNDYEKVDVLCNNAGIMAIPRMETGDGFEKQFGVNHLGHFALTAQLVPLLEDADEPRVVTHSSGLHERGEIDFDDLMKEENYDPDQAYADSKLANVLFAYELNRRSSEIKSMAVHPGFAATNLQNAEENSDPGVLKSAVMGLVKKVVAQSAERGAYPMLYAATEDLEGGEYVGPGGFMKMRGLPEVQESSVASHDTDTAERLWEVSEELTGLEFDL